MGSTVKFGVALAMLLGASSQAGCSNGQAPAAAQPADATPAPPQASPETPAQPAAATVEAAAIAPGAYATEGGWGQLSIAPAESGGATFSLETVNGEAGCAFSGKLAGTQATVLDGANASACVLDFAAKPGAIAVGSRTDAACRTYCGGNGSYQGDYAKLVPACVPDAVQKGRDAFKAAYDAKAYADADAALAPIYRDCLATLSFVDEGGVRNDYALNRHKLHDDAACLAALARYDGDLDKTDDELTDGMAPAVVDDYLAVVGAARTNAKLCGRKAAR